MDKKKALKDVLDLCKAGKFKESLDVLNNIDEEFNIKWIISFIIGCCNCVSNVSFRSETVAEQNLCDFLKYITSCITDVNEKELLGYVQSLFHILKYFIRKKSCKLIATMENILVPSFLPSSLPKKHIDTYLSSASLLHNFIATIDQGELEDLVEICKILSKMYAKVSNSSGLLGTAYNCAIRLSNRTDSIEVLENYFFHTLSLLKLDNMNVNMEEDFKNFLSHFTLIYNIILKKFDFKEAAKFYENTYRIVVEIFIGEDCIRAIIILRFPLLLCPLNSEEKLEHFLKCKRSLSNLENTVLKQQLGSKLLTLIYTIVFSYYKSENNSVWCKNPKSYHIEFLHFIWEISRLELLPKFTCSCKCLIDQNIYQAFSYSQYLYSLLEICVHQKIESSDFNRDAMNLLVQFCDDIKILKEYNCERWKSTWSLFSNGLYNIGLYLYRNSDEGCLHYFYNLIKYYIKFEFRDALKISKFSMIGSAFHAVCCHNIKDYKKCMALSALGIKLCPNERSSLITSWIKAKVSQRDLKTVEGTEAQKLTLVSVFTQLKKEMDFLTDGANLLTPADRIELLIFELEQYKLKWKSKVPIMSALKELQNTADLNLFVEVIVTIFCYCDLVHDDLPNVVKRTLIQFEKKVSGRENTTPLLTIYLAVLHYMHYKYCVKDTINKNSDVMERTMAVTTQKTDEPPDAIPRDPNEECDIVSSYDSLKLNKYFSVMKYLNKSLDLFSSVIKDNLNPSIFKKFKIGMLFDLLFSTAMEYRLHRYKVKSLQALQLALKVAEFEKNICNIVWITSFIIENSDVNKSYVKYLQLIAEKHLTNIECDSVHNLKILLTYYIFKAKSLLYEDYKEAFRFYKMATEMYEVQEDKSELLMIKSQLHLLHFKFVLMPCKYNIVDHNTSTLLTIYLANQTVYEMYNKQFSPIDPYAMSVILDINEELIKLNHLLRCPREVRAYCRETIILTQKLVLPLRCAYYLVYLAHADLRSSRYYDSQVKIDGLGEILCLSKYHPQIDQENNPPPFADLDNDIEITKKMQEVVLDVPQNYKKQFSSSSPALVIEPFHLPSFLNHEDGCDCFYCTSLEYQGLVQEKYRLDAFLNVKLSNFTISADFFHGALNFYEQCSVKYETSVDSIAKLISYDLIPEYSREMLEPYGFTLLDYSYHLRRTKIKEDALKISNKLIDLVSVKKIQHIYLYNDALFQKLGYLTEVPETAPKEKKTLELDTLCPEPDVVSVTPESKHSKVTVSVPYSPSFSPPKRRVKKCLTFNLSPNSDNSNNGNQKDAHSPVMKVNKSPSPKIKIYSSGITKSKNCSTFTNDSRRTKTTLLVDNGSVATPALLHPGDLSPSHESFNTNRLLGNISPISKPPKTPSVKMKLNSNDGTAQKYKNPSSTIQIYNDETKKSKKKILKDDCAAASSACLSTPVSLRPPDSEKGLRTRTKLLTDKLRQSTKKPEKLDDCVSQADVPNGKKLASRRNLFDQGTSDKESNVSRGGAIRKSTRTKKV